MTAPRTPRSASRRARLEDLDKFTLGYMAAALWTFEGGAKYDRTSIAAATRAQMKEDCQRFQTENKAALHHAYYDRGYEEEQAGQDFWLTRNRHGTGFWDRDLAPAVGTALTNAAHKFGGVDLYESRGKVHQVQKVGTQLGKEEKKTVSPARRRASRVSLPRWSDTKGWKGGDSRRLYAFVDNLTGRVTVHHGNAGLRHSSVPVGPNATVRPATRLEAEQHWQSPLHAGWKVV